MQKGLPAGHLACHINDTIGTLDMSAFFKRDEGGGSRNSPFHPAMMVKVLVYSYATGVLFSRKVARKRHEYMAFRVLAAGNFPKHRTLCECWAVHLKEFAALFVQVVKLAGESGLIKLGTIDVDGAKLRASASRHKTMRYERMQVAEIELKAQIDVAQTNKPELNIPAEIARREQRVTAIRVAKQRIEAHQRDQCLPERMRAHASICFMALILHRVVRMRLRAAHTGVTPKRALQSLETHPASPGVHQRRATAGRKTTFPVQPDGPGQGPS